MSSTAARKPTDAMAGTVGELVTEAAIDALNRDLAAHGVDASHIIAIFSLPAQPVANGAPARYRVLPQALRLFAHSPPSP